MATTVTTPVYAFGATVISGTAFNQSANATVAFNITGVVEAYVHLWVKQPATNNLSAGPEFHAYRSNDGGTTYDTVPWASSGINKGNALQDQTTLRLETGMYLLRVISGGGSASTWSFAINTYELVSALQNQ